MKIYRGKKAKIGKRRSWFEIRVEGDGRISRLLKIPIMRFSGVEWEGAGDPTSIALGILIDFFEEFPTANDLRVGGKTEAQKHFIGFRRFFIMPLLKLEEWTITEKDIREWLEARAASGLFGSEVVITEEEDG
jgi:hypothetical protein